MNRPLCAALLALALGASEATAQDARAYIGDYTSASGLARDCALPPEGQRTPENYIAIGRCIAYFDGFRDAYQVDQTFRRIDWQLSDEPTAPAQGYYRFCWPTSLEVHPARTFLAFLDRNPNRHAEPAFDVFADAMLAEYGTWQDAHCE